MSQEETQLTDHDLLIRIDERTKVIQQQQLSFNQVQADHEKRLKNLEDWQSNLMGRFAVIVGIIAIVGSVAGSLVIQFIQKRF